MEQKKIKENIENLIDNNYGEITNMLYNAKINEDLINQIKHSLIFMRNDILEELSKI